MTLLEPAVGQVLKHVQVDTAAGGNPHYAQTGDEPLVSAESRKLARQTLIGAPIPMHMAKTARTQSLRYTGRSALDNQLLVNHAAIYILNKPALHAGKYADTSYVINAPQGDPATVYAHNSIWPSKVHHASCLMLPTRPIFS